MTCNVVASKTLKSAPFFTERSKYDVVESVWRLLCAFRRDSIIGVNSDPSSYHTLAAAARVVSVCVAAVADAEFTTFPPSPQSMNLHEKKGIYSSLFVLRISNQVLSMEVFHTTLVAYM